MARIDCPMCGIELIASERFPEHYAGWDPKSGVCSASGQAISGRTQSVMRKKWMGSKVDKCDICTADIAKKGYFVDGATVMGPWAKMCRGCHMMKGVGLGTGRGQAYQYDRRDDAWYKVEPGQRTSEKRIPSFDVDDEEDARETLREKIRGMHQRGSITAGERGDLIEAIDVEGVEAVERAIKNLVGR